MAFPVKWTEFDSNPYQPEWHLTDFMHTQDGIGDFPKHHCKMTFVKSVPFIKNRGIAIDVGCRDGEYSRYLQQEFEHVYAFDARRRKLFPYNVDLSKVTHFTCGLGDQVEVIEMFGGTHDKTRGKRHEVACHPLDAFGFENVSYIKIDVEGFEKKVLIGAEQTILRDRPLIVIEQNEVMLDNETDPLAAKRWLEERGYSHVATCDRGWDYIMAPNA